jgi:predicted esterase
LYVSLIYLLRSYKMKKFIYALSFISLSNTVIGMELEQRSKTHLIVVPGQNGLGGIINGQIVSNTDIVLPQLKDQRHFVETPNWMIDFGQGRCLSYLEKTMSSLPKDNKNKVILHASSQGTATALNYTANNPQKVSALILEAVMLSGNSAISHTLLGSPDSMAYYALPYAAKIVFPWYAPGGEQPILNLDKLPTNIPVIIIHATGDPQLSFQDAQALYAALAQKNKNVHLIDKKEYAHVLLLNESNTSEINAIQHILHQAGLLPSGPDYIASFNYQPEHKPEWVAHFNNLLIKEKRIWWIDKGVKLTLCGLIMYLLHRWGITEKISAQISPSKN